jgi:hypothetical protein
MRVQLRLDSVQPGVKLQQPVFKYLFTRRQIDHAVSSRL